MKQMIARTTLLGVAAYLLFLAITLPAVLVIPTRWPGGTELVNMSGSVWTGSAQSLVWRGRRLGRLEWRFALPALLGGRFGLWFGLQGQGIQASGEVMQSWFTRHVILANLKANLDASRVDQFMQTVQLGGNLSVHVTQAAWTPSAVSQLTGSVNWTNASLVQPINVRLGTAQIRSVPDANGQTFKLTLQGGDPRGQGSATLNPRGQYRLDVELTAHSAEARQLLGTLGHGMPRGSLHLVRSGDLRSLLAGIGMRF